MGEHPDDERSEARRQRGELRERISDWLDVPLSVLAFVMLGLLVLELAADLGPPWAGRVEQAQTAIWVIFAATFALELLLAPSKLDYLKKNWLTAISVLLPAFRVVRLFRVARALRGLRLVRIVTGLNRGTRALGNIVRRGQLGYVLLLTLVVTVTSAAGAYYFERTEPGANILTPGDAFWWAIAIVDVGGGNGTLIAAVLAAHPEPRGIVFDLPHARDGALQRLAAAGLAGRCEFVGGDFFASVPAGADAYLLKWIIHDWDDRRSLTILRACRRAMAPDSKLPIVERLLPPGNESAPDAVLGDVTMLVQTGGRERTLAEYRALLEAADLRLANTVATTTPFSILEAVPTTTA